MSAFTVAQKRMVAVMFLLLALPFGHNVLAQGKPEPPLTNEDVVKLTKLGLGDEIVIAKINQAKDINFRLDIDSLVQLKKEGVSKAVIEAMLKRATPTQVQEGKEGVPATQSPNVQEGVWLQTSQGTFQMQPVLGDLSATSIVLGFIFFLDFPELKATLRITDRKPVFIVRSSKSPRGRIFLVKCEPDKGDNVRSVKVGKASFGGMKSWSSPDPDWTIACDVTETEPSVFQIVPKVDLAPGEYGLLFRGGFTGLLGTQQGELYDFGVD